MIEQRYTPRFLFSGDPAENGHATPVHENGHVAACPACGRSDTAGKASVIARSGRGRFVLEDGSSAQFQSELAGLLAEPTRPHALPVSSVVSALVVGWLLLAVDLAIVAGLRYQDFVTIPSVTLEVATWLGLAWFGFLIPGLAILRYFASRDRAHREMPAWRYAVERWRQLHYCSRDDVVFMPGESQMLAPEHTSLLLLPLKAPREEAASKRTRSRTSSRSAIARQSTASTSANPPEPPASQSPSPQPSTPQPSAGAE